MKANHLKLAAAVAAMLACSAAANATTYTWNFQNADAGYPVWGTSHAFDTNPVASGNLITAYGFDTHGAAAALYSKYTAGDPGETGLGLATVDKEGDHELDAGSSVVFGLNTLLSHTYTLTLGSLQDYGTTAPAENANIYECTTLSCSVERLLGNIVGPPVRVSATYTLDAGYSFLKVLDQPAGGGADVLIDSVSTTTSVPEPAAFLLLGMAFAGVGVLRRRRAA